MVSGDRRELGRVFNEVPDLYDRVRPTYPDELFADLVAVTGIDGRSSLLEVGCGTGQATRSLAELGCRVTAVEPGAGLAELARQRLATFPNVTVETSTFEEWDDRDRRFDVLVAASAWHWVDPSVGWRRAHDLLHRGGWMALLGNVVVRKPGEPEVYAETADLHERFAPGNPDWRDPPLEVEVRARRSRVGVHPTRTAKACSARRSCAGIPRCSGSTGMASPISSARCRRTGDSTHDVREPLLEAIADANPNAHG